MIHTIEDVKKEAKILLKCKDLFTDVGFIDRVVTIAKTYADTREITKKEWIDQLEAMLKSRTQEVKELKEKIANLPKKTTQVIKPIPKTFTVSKSDYEWLQMNRPTHLPKSNK